MAIALHPHPLLALASTANEEHRLAVGNAASAIEHALRAGQCLLDAKERMSHGEWLPWLATNVEFSERHARNYMRLAANRQRVADLEAAGESSLRRALQTLAQPANEPTASIDAEDWSALRDLIRSADQVLSTDAAKLAADVPARRRTATARKLRALGVGLGRIAWILEGMETQ